MGRAVAASRGQSGKGYTAGLWAARQTGAQVICHSERMLVCIPTWWEFNSDEAGKLWCSLLDEVIPNFKFTPMSKKAFLAFGWDFYLEVSGEGRAFMFSVFPWGLLCYFQQTSSEKRCICHIIFPSMVSVWPRGSKAGWAFWQKIGHGRSVFNRNASSAKSKATSPLVMEGGKDATQAVQSIYFFH